MEEIEKIPKYMQVYKTLLSRIEQDIYDVGSCLPSETDLQKEFEVSRITIRRALQDLENDGYVKRKRGRLTEVLPKKTYSNFAGVSGFNAAQERTGARPSSIILSFGIVAATPTVAEYLQVPIGSDVYHLKRLRLKNGRIVGLHETYIHPEVGKNINQSDLNEHTSIYGLYKNMGIKIASADEAIESRIASKQLKQQLYLEEDEPIMYRERITYSDENKPIEYSQNSYRAYDFKYLIHLSNI